MGDDGAGIEVVNELQGSDLPEYVDVIDGGTPGVGLIDLMSGYSRVIVVDAVIGDNGHSEFISGSQTMPVLGHPETMLKQLQYKVRDDRGDDGCSLHETELTSVLRLMQT